MPTSAPGRRERKKALTRQALADAAVRLFLERGFDAVTVAEIAEAADVSVSTLFQHFPSKEALVFARPDEGTLGEALEQRAPGTPVLTALCDAFLGDPAGESLGPTPELVALVDRTPALVEHLARRWVQQADTLVPALAEATGRDPGDVRIQALARYVVIVPSIVRTHADRRQAIRDVFTQLEQGWGAL